MDSGDEDFKPTDKAHKKKGKKKQPKEDQKSDEEPQEDKDEREERRMKNKLKQKQKKDAQKKGKEVDINQFITGGAEHKPKHQSDEDERKEEAKAKQKKEKKPRRAKNRNKQAEDRKDQGDDDEKDEGEGHEDHEDHEEKEQDDEQHEKKEHDHDEEHEGKKAEGEGEEEEKHHVEKNPNWPATVYYCTFCTVPPEFCSFYSADLEGCKQKLRHDNPHLFGVVYEGREDEASEENKGKKKKNKAAKKAKEFDKTVEVRIVKLKRGGKKMVTEINGLDGYGLNLKDFSKKMGKKFACGNSVVRNDETGDNFVQLLGDVDEDALLETIKLEFPEVAKAKLIFESGGNKKGRKQK
uniref:SUI1 domain-containing protein n=1 Tax=Euplotes harpa TaxID=151035 RepID=A0A7S3J7S9_9SPIT|mmetsp:Transcript_22124/g.25429  ORF Transcript_22124/g.25429 Transcript_22124/m.25429 type:complete len:352 (+) Transcript_22124:25-1080(+)